MQEQEDIKTLRYNKLLTRIRKNEQKLDSLEHKIDIVIKSLRR